MPTRATHDPEVVAAWTRTIAAWRQRPRLAWRRLTLALFACLGLGIVLQNGHLFLMIVACLPALLAVQYRDYAALRGPHYSRPAVSPRQSPPQVAACPHGRYWLKSPRP